MFCSEVIIMWFFYPNVGLCCCGRPWLLHRVKQWRDWGEKKIVTSFYRSLLFFDTIARNEYSLKLFLSNFNLLLSINTSMMQHFGLEDLSHVQSRHNRLLSCLSGNGFWLVYEDLSIDFGRTNFLQNRDMACKLGCGLCSSWARN